MRKKSATAKADALKLRDEADKLSSKYEIHLKGNRTDKSKHHLLIVWQNKSFYGNMLLHTVIPGNGRPEQI